MHIIISYISITFLPGESADGLVEKYKAVIEQLGEKDGILFIVDLFGGSPYNAASIKELLFDEKKKDPFKHLIAPIIIIILNYC